MGRIFETRKATMFARWNKMAKAFTRISKDITIAVKSGGPIVESNPALRRAVQNARAANMPKDKVELLAGWIEQGAPWPDGVKLEAKKAEAAPGADEGEVVKQIPLPKGANRETYGKKPDGTVEEGTETIKVNVRLIAATNKDMEQAIAQGTFREDLYYRLNVFTIFVPPLRDRKADLLLLADHFLEKFSREHGKVIKRISTPAIDMLMSYHWPGNVRELENTLERAVLMCDGQVIHGHHLPPSLQTAEASNTVTRVSLADAVAGFEKDLLQDALKTTRGNRAKAARLLDTTERVLNYKVRKYGIDVRRFTS